MNTLAALIVLNGYVATLRRKVRTRVGDNDVGVPDLFEEGS